MRWPWQRKQRQAALDPATEAFIRSLQQLSPTALEIARQRVTASGIGSSHESAVAVAIVVASAMPDGDGDRLKPASHMAMDVIKHVPGVTPADFQVAYAAATAAEAIEMRARIDPETWEFLTRPWVGIATLPAQWVGSEPAAVADMRRARESLASHIE